MRRLLLAMLLLLLAVEATVADEPWQRRLYTPTQITQLDDLYLIVDCWHHRVLYSDKLDRPISEWKTLDETLGGPHSIDSDGELYVVEDTGRHGLRVYKREKDSFRKVQELGPFGKRTHRVRYDRATKAFYVLSLNDQTITKLPHAGDQLKAQYSKKLPFLKDVYTRSMTIDGDSMYFVSGPGVITKVPYRDDSYEVLATYKVPNGMNGANDIFKTDDGWWYLTSTSRTGMVRAKSLEQLDAGEYEDACRMLGCKGIPYYLAKIDGRYFVPQITSYSSIISFVHQDGKIADIKTHFDFGPPNASDKKRCNALPR